MRGKWSSIGLSHPASAQPGSQSSPQYMTCVGVLPRKRSIIVSK